MELAKTNLPTASQNTNQQTLQTAHTNDTTSISGYWQTAYQRVNYYLYLNRVPVNEQQHILQAITEKAEQVWQHVTEENQLIRLFIEEAQRLLHHNKQATTSQSEHATKTSSSSEAYYPQVGRLRTSTGPNIHRCSIRPAVLEKISVRRKRTAHHH
ncbi:MAG TPA: hypothetical protein ENK78_08150 [Thiothrix sp.]|nr:hypothetical protein [Thiothrix sp.]